MLIPYEKRLVYIINFLRVICIEGNGYDVKQLVNKIATGSLTFKEAIDEWVRLGWYLLVPYEEVIK